ncbi:MAG TPA: transcription-repair coupling factor [Spirochaetales bacterium]|nr:transcription-repair coupling factor [Spirochaetales bacterium]
MNTLYPQDVLERLSAHAPLRSLLARLRAGPFPVDISEAEGAFASVVAAIMARAAPGAGLLVVVPTDQEAESVASDLSLLGLRSDLLPWWRSAAYRAASPRARAFGDRAAVLARLVLGEARVLVASQRAFVTPLPPRGAFEPLVFALSVGESIDPTALGERLASYGYLRVPRVSLPGEFALRGEVLDLYMPGDEAAVRIVFEYDRIERVASFDPAGQAGLKDLGRVALRPMKELVWSPERTAAVAKAAAAFPNCEGRMGPLLEALAERGEAKGEELWYPVAFGAPAAGGADAGAAPAAGGASAAGGTPASGGAGSILDYLAAGSAVLFLDRERLESQEEAARKEYAGLYRGALKESPVPPPDRLIHSFVALERRATEAGLRLVRDFALRDKEGESRLSLGAEPPRSFFGNVTYFKEELASLLKAGYEVRIFAETDSQAERIRTLLKDYAVDVRAAGISAGFAIPALKLLVVQEGEIFGRRKRVPKSVKSARSSVIDTFVELNPGDYVVHINYGIGRFTSIERMRVLGNERDYVKIEYADEENVFVPIEQANLVQRYLGNEGEAPRLDRLGSKSWENRKSKVRKSVEELAERLIRIYARRKAAQGYAFPPDSDWQLAFEASFPYEETADQLRCIDEVKADMESRKPMDRLVCGDVGYGKTEIAMRACFKAAIAGKQVAFLAPTTILAEQHFENFKERFEGYPVEIAMMSRLVEKRDQRKTLEGLREGKVDLVIGTHRLLQKDLEWKDLGLIVVDEEQRFGVKDKERLKEMRASVDSLTLTATPIPRTLHMSLLKIRDMSVLQTPPSTRLPIETVVEEFNPELIAEAIRREIARGGQIFYLHNRIESLDEVQTFLGEVVPEVLVETAHGQMDPTELEDIMHRFIHGGFQVLVSTTIIENGIDIPNVNTIVIDRADMYGVSQLYQLRGRVGRSDRPAYAYLFYPDRRALSELAMKRLQIISDFTELGSGFKIAMKDLEVRGAGNLLGREQSGDIYAVGFDLYLKLLDETVARLSDEKWEPEEETYLELEYRGYLPDEYISMPTLKMEVYKKIASIFTDQDLEALRAELLDRFGPLPEEAESLLALAEIRVICRKLSVASLKERGGVVIVEFSKVAKVSVERVLRLIRESGGRIKLDPHRPNVLVIKTGTIGLKEKSEFLREKLATLLA